MKLLEVTQLVGNSTIRGILFGQLQSQVLHHISFLLIFPFVLYPSTLLSLVDPVLFPQGKFQVSVRYLYS